MTPSVPGGPAAESLHCPNCGAAVDEHAPQCPYCQARLATISCPSCFKRLFLGAAYCSHCGARASREDGGEAERAGCPRCHKRMEPVRVGSFSLLECAACGGVWVGATAFERLCADREAQASVLGGTALRGPLASSMPAQEERIRYRPCPRCQTMMNRVNFAAGSGVVLDVCRSHGTFFDRDELHRVIAFIQGGGLDRARAKERDALKEEQRRLQALQRAQPSGATHDYAGMPIGGGGLFDLFVRSLLER
jgi:Zn-finger nucleic acid-binding protein